MIINKEKVKEEFQAYVELYNHKDPRIKLKIEHTYQVALISERIAVSLNLKEEEIELAWLIGMLHDIGRFEQLKKYGTFIDAKSINHSHYGVGILFEGGFIRTFIKDNQYDEIIRNAIWYHNAYQLPNDLEKRTKLFCDMIRDADKIDILRVNVEMPIHVVYDFNKDQMKDSIASKEVMENYFNHQAVKHSIKKSPLDYMIGHISLAFELVFPVSIVIVEEQGYLQKMLNFKPENETAKKQFKELKDEMIAYIKSFKEGKI